jgi:hypothetical protein
MFLGILLTVLALSILVTYALSFVRWRPLVGSIGFACIAIGTRLMEFAQRSNTPTGPKLVLKVREEWERPSLVEAFRDEEHVVVFAPGRFLRFKR